MSQALARGISTRESVAPVPTVTIKAPPELLAPLSYEAHMVVFLALGIEMHMTSRPPEEETDAYHVWEQKHRRLQADQARFLTEGLQRGDPRMQDLEQRRTGIAGLTWFHGTFAPQVRAIQAQGFAVQRGSKKQKFGTGIYLSEPTQASLYGIELLECTVHCGLTPWTDPVCEAARQAVGWPPLLASPAVEVPATPDQEARLRLAMLERGVQVAYYGSGYYHELVVYDPSVLTVQAIHTL